MSAAPGVRRGRIISFYSYKGGTGRSMAVANVGWILASRGKRVLLVDWDLEAPGLHRYLHPFLEDRELAQSCGVIDFLTEFSVAARTAHREEDGASKPGWFEPYTNILGYVLPVTWDHFGDAGVLDFLPAGRQGPSYAVRVTGLNWGEFYDTLGGGVFLQAVKEKLRAEYDYILVDSRTGLSDAAGICTVQLPDDLVVCFTLNRQSLYGAAAVAESAFRQRLKPSGEPGLFVWPVSTRVELAERDRLEQGRTTARRVFLPYLKHLPRTERDAYWGRMEVLYQPYFAYEEVLATLADRKRQTNSMLASMEALTEAITHGEVMGGLAEIDEKDRAEGLRAYGAVRDAQDHVASGRFYVSYSHEEKRDVRRIVDALIESFGEGHVWVDYKDVQLGDSWPEQMAKGMESAAAVVAVFGPKDEILSETRTMELAAALRRGLAVVPVFLDASPKILESLPEELRALSRTHGARIERSSLEEDTEKLVNGIRHLLSTPTSSPPIDPEDPQKGRWGGRSSESGRSLSASVRAVNDAWFEVVLEVSGSTPPLTGPVEFHLHPTFSPSVQRVESESNRAVLHVGAWGAFTVGATADEGRTRLELDLAQLPEAPTKFRER